MLIMANLISEGRKKDECGLGFLFGMEVEQGIFVQCSVTRYSIGSKRFFSSL